MALPRIRFIDISHLQGRTKVVALFTLFRHMGQNDYRFRLPWGEAGRN